MHRELAEQIAREARALLTFHTNLTVEIVIGGTNIKSERSRLLRGCDVLVATPGRLVDHLESTDGFAAAMSRSCRAFVLDEADKMLDMGFRPALDRILAVLPAQRQTLLFSATVPQSVLQMTKVALRASHKYINTVSEAEAQTNVQVHQEYVLTTMDNVLPTLVRTVRHQTRVMGHKVIVFFTTARLTSFMAAIFSAMGTPVLEMHSRKSQSQRSAASKRFFEETDVVMFSSDVSARGMDYPDVTAVIQVGLTDREQYIHRLGRTARAGKEGCGLLLLAGDEHVLLRDLKDLPLSRATDSSMVTGGLANGVREQLINGRPSYDDLPALTKALASVARSDALANQAAMGYQAWLGAALPAALALVCVC